MIRLTDEEIREIYLDRAIERFGIKGGAQIISQLESVNNGQDIAQAQLKKVVKILKDEIEMRGDFDHQDSAYSNAKDKRWYFQLYMPQEDWDSFWQALLKETEGGSNE